jgi:uncharacterized protein YprB with RNaseH-like and TPR domain
MSKKKQQRQSPRVLFVDIETAPCLAYVWGLYDQNPGLDMLKEDWHLLSFCAKWQGDKSIIYMDQSNAKNVEDDNKLVKALWNLLDEAEIVVGQNVKKFDIKKINARFLAHGLPPPSGYRVIDTLAISKKNFALTSNKLAYLTKKFNKKHVKLAHKKFGGFSLWAECLKGNKEAWKEMKLYNIADVTSLEELYNTLAVWDNTINFDVYHDDLDHICSCGSKNFHLNGYRYTNMGKYRRYKCTSCGKERQSKVNELSKEKRKSMRE